MTEFVIGAPVLLALLLSMIQLVPVYHSWIALTDAVRVGARVAAQSRTDSNRVTAIRQAILSSARDLDTSQITIDAPTSTWSANTNVTVCAHYPFSVNVLAVNVASGRFDSCTTQILQ